MPASGEYRITCELFLVPWDGHYILYAPLKGIVAKLNPSAAALLRDVQSGATFHVTPGEQAALEQLIAVGVVNGDPDPQLPVFEGQPFAPLHATLFLTNACNLRCVYCYAEAGEAADIRTIAPEAARAAIDFVAANARRQGVDTFSVGFHGAGEPTLAWDSYVALVDYARARAARHGLRAAISTATNGVLDESRARWIARNTLSANVSVDGPADVHDAQRPRGDGRGSWEALARTLRVFDEEDFCYAIRATITDLNVRRMAEMVELFTDDFHPQDLQFDPLIYTGRCRETKLRPPAEELFVDEFCRALDVAHARGRLVGFSSVGFSGYRTYFCGAAADGFTVTHEGYVTACFEAYSPQRPFGDRFVYGRYDVAAGAFEFDLAKLAKLQARHVYRLPYCEKCFCKYMCAGDCPIHALYKGQAGEHGLRCKAVQAIARHRLVTILQDQERATSG